MSTTCKLCARQLVDEDIEQIAGHEYRVELLEYIFAKFNLQYEAKDILCVGCQKNLKAMKLVMSRWQEAQKKQRATTISLLKTTTPVASTEQETLLIKPTAGNIEQETLLKKPTAGNIELETLLKKSPAASPSKVQVQINTKSADNAKTQNIRQAKSIIQNKRCNTAATTLRFPASKVKTKVDKPTMKTKECEKEIVELNNIEDEDISQKKVPLTRSVLKKKLNKVETSKETKTIERKPIRKIHNIGFKKDGEEEVYDDDDEEEPEEQLEAQTQLKPSSPEKTKNKNNDSAEDLEVEYEKDIKENYSELEFQTSEPIDINDIGTLLQVGLIRSANGVTVATIFEENKNDTKENESVQSCIICGLCQDIITSIREFHRHLKGHAKHTYQCKECLQTFNSMVALQTHQECSDHLGINTIILDDDRKMIFYECVICEKVFLEQYNLSRHHRDVHRAPSDRYKCTQCGSCFKYKVSLTTHLAKHMQININSKNCDHCDRMFKNNYQLKRHMRIHTGEKPYECETCKKTFRHSANLNVHKRTHTGELPFICTVCAKGFSTSTHMRRHLKSCEKRFKNIKLPTMVTLKEEELRYLPQKSTKSEVVFTLNTEKIINNDHSDSLLKRNLIIEGVGAKRRATESQTQSPKKQKTQQQLQKKQKQQQQQEEVQFLQVEILPKAEKKLPTIFKKCTLCTKVFKDPEALRRHIATHEEVATLCCDLCPKRFSHPYLFKRHKLEHSIKPSKLSLQKGAATTMTHDDDDEADDDKYENIQEIVEDDDTILLDFQIDKLEPVSPGSSMQLQSHDDGIDTSTLNNFRIVRIEDM